MSLIVLFGYSVYVWYILFWRRRRIISAHALWFESSKVILQSMKCHNYPFYSFYAFGRNFCNNQRRMMLISDSVCCLGFRITFFMSDRQHFIVVIYCLRLFTLLVLGNSCMQSEGQWRGWDPIDCVDSSCILRVQNWYSIESRCIAFVVPVFICTRRI